MMSKSVSIIVTTITNIQIRIACLHWNCRFKIFLRLPLVCFEWDLQDSITKSVTIKGLYCHQSLIIICHRHKSKSFAFVRLQISDHLQKNLWYIYKMRSFWLVVITLTQNDWYTQFYNYKLRQTWKIWTVLKWMFIYHLQAKTSKIFWQEYFQGCI